MTSFIDRTIHNQIDFAFAQFARTFHPLRTKLAEAMLWYYRLLPTVAIVQSQPPNG
jgi:hypothetical protein